MILWLTMSALWATPMTDLLKQPVTVRVQELKAQPKLSRDLERIAFDVNQLLTLRWRAITTMGRLDAGHFRPHISRALESRDWFMRNAGLIAVLSDDRAHALKVSERRLDDRALIVRTQAVRNLIALDGHEASARLWRELKNPRNFKDRESLWIRAHIAEALSRWASPGQARAFGRLLLDEDERLHRWAVRGLEKAMGYRLGDPSDPVEVQRARWLERVSH